jgi:hypothetical protein
MFEKKYMWKYEKYNFLKKYNCRKSLFEITFFYYTGRHKEIISGNFYKILEILRNLAGLDFSKHPQIVDLCNTHK